MGRKKTLPIVVEPKVISENTLQAEELPPVIVATQQEVDVLSGLAAGKSPKKAVEAAGMDVSREVADVYCGGLQRRYNTVMQAALLRQGVTVDKIAEVISDQFEAEKPVIVAGKGMVMVTDNPARQGAVNIALDILPGARAPKKVEVETRSLEAILLKIEIDHGD
jgi:hypothetical protein